MGKDDISGSGVCRNCVVEGNVSNSIQLNDFSCEFSNERVSDEDLLAVNFKAVNKMDNFEQDFCICRRCRTLSSTWSSRSPSFQERNVSSFSRQSRTSSVLSRTRNEGDGGQEKLFGAEEEEVPCFSSDVNFINTAPDDVPLLLGDSGETEIEESIHCHVNNRSPVAVQKARRKLIISSFLCLIFMLAEVIGGYLSNSLAIMTDAAHLLSDLASFLISLFAIWVAQKAPTRRMSFGYYRAEVLGAVLSVLLIWVLTGILVYMAVQRVRFQDYDIDANVMLIISGAGVVMNIIMGLVLHGPCGGHHGHSHGIPSSHSHLEDSTSSHTPQNINVRAAFIHVIGDLVQSIGVLIAAYIIRYKPEYKLADPICTFIFSLLVMFTTLSIMKDAVHVLMEGFPRNLNYSDVKNELTNLKGVKGAHNLHIWSLTIDKNSLSVHLAVDPAMDPHAVLQEAQILIRRLYKIYHSTIQIEKYDPSCMIECKACQGPPV